MTCSSPLCKIKYPRMLQKKLNAETETFDAHQGDNVGSTAAGELTRSINSFVVSPFPECLEILELLCRMVNKIESNPTNKKNYDAFLLEHRCLTKNAFERQLSGTRIIAVCNVIRSCLRLKQSVSVHCE